MNAGDATFHSCWTYHNAASNTTENTRIVFAIEYYDADATIPLQPPTNEWRAANLARWFPGAVPWGPAATAKNPAILSPAIDGAIDTCFLRVACGRIPSLSRLVQNPLP
ncbi:hypothetical protein BKA82DRAFT_368774 [Pisolithus tinctorius]|uniref:Phytanoyl-CoA dioxygenase family protein n=1 Tax=Pisolithus tinctorius Marx 270 TaxID=870435 RepID=A0A0C3ICW9_PISTI|nr:hypothetical protein BKA82DRAFT_368774 [Pisolithus tinctorius]KIN94872.1 hypothetical protein M404DRAFT_368774 [Pisolithus tinctorius Marx 270]